MNTTKFQALINENLRQAHEELILRAFIPPGNIASELDKYQARLFAITGDPTVRYLSPVVPVDTTVAEAAPVRLESIGELDYCAPSPGMSQEPFGILYFPARLIDAADRAAEAPLVIGISTLSSEVLQPELQALSQSPLRLRPEKAHAGYWRFAVSKAVELTLTWLWDDLDEKRSGSLNAQSDVHLTPGRLPLGLLQRHHRH